MSKTSVLMDTLRQEGVSPDLLRAVEEYRTAHPLAEALRPRIPSPAFVYYGREVWDPKLDWRAKLILLHFSHTDFMYFAC